MSTERSIRWAALAGCTALVGALGVPGGASAHIGATHAPFTTQRLDLRTAAFQPGPGNVKVCEDQAVGAIASSASAQVIGYDSARRFAWPAGQGTLDADPNCVLLPVNAPGPTPNGPSDIANMTVFTQTQGFVTGTSGQNNTDGAVSLTGVNTAAQRDHTDALELQSVATVPPTSADYTFDRNADQDPDAPAGTSASDFGFQTSAGDTGTCEGTGTVTFNGNIIRVSSWTNRNTATAAATCTPGPGAAGAVRFWVDTQNPPIGQEEEEGSICTLGTSYGISDRGTARRAADDDDNAKMNILGTVGTGAAGANAPGPTDDPDIDPSATTKTGTNTLSAKFDEALVNTGATAPVAGCFLGFEADGDIHQATGAVVSNPTGGSDTVQVTFGSLPMDQLQVLGVLPGAVTSSVTANEVNSYGVVEFSDTLEPGFTDSGDLEQLTINAARNRATYCFDIDESLVANAPANFQLLDASGSVIGTGNAFVNITENCTTIGFPAAVVMANAVAGGLNSVGVIDDVGTATTPNQLNTTAPGFAETGGNLGTFFAHVATGGPPPTGAPPGPTPPTPPTTPPGVPTVRTGLCDASRPTAPLAELVIGTNGADLICGFAGDDILRGLAGADTLRGMPDDDVAAGGRGTDNVRGGPGDDTLRGGKGSDTITGGGGTDTGRGGMGHDLCRAETQQGCEA